MSAQPAYDLYASAIPRPRPSSPSIDVIRGRGQHESSLSPTTVMLCRALAVVMIVIACLGFARIALHSATVSVSLQSQELSSQIESARIEGNKLELVKSSLSNPTNIKAAAAGLGMVAPEETTYVDISDDVVRTDEAGNLSLYESVSVLTQE